LEFSTFNRKIFGIFKFRSEKNLPFKLSRQKKPAVPDFKPKFFGRKNFQTVRAGRDRPEKFPGNVLASSEASPERGFFHVRGDRFGNFWRESSYTRKNFPNASFAACDDALFCMEGGQTTCMTRVLHNELPLWPRRTIWW